MRHVTPCFGITAVLLALVCLDARAADSPANPASASQRHPDRANRFAMRGVVSKEGAGGGRPAAPGATEAPAGFDETTNGFLPQGPAFESLTKESVVPLRSFNDDRFVFEQVESEADGVGPVYNGRSCAECHQNVVTGNGSQVTVQRTGRLEGRTFFESIGGSLIHSRAVDPSIVEHVADTDGVRTFRISTSGLGAGFVETIANGTLLAIRDAQPAQVRGLAVVVPVLEAGGQARIGRFGWKSQHASLESFAGDAYVNEMGITNPLFPEENTSSGVYVGFGTAFDLVAEPEDDGEDMVAFADFLRSTKAPPRGPRTSDVDAGERAFAEAGCVACHVAAITTAPAGTIVNGGEFTVPEALGNKIIHPYGDFLLHDIGTGDGIPLLPTAEMANTARMFRTAPLWGLRTRNRLMHDGLSFTLDEAIQRHRGQAQRSVDAWNRLAPDRKRQGIAFLGSL